MRRLLAITLVSGVVLAACGSDDTPDAASEATPTSLPTPTTPGSAAATSATTSAPRTDPERCETAPDPADYTDPPTAVRPCELPTELVAQTVVEGTGDEAAAGDTIFVDYVGIRSVNGEEFDSSFSRGQPFSFALGQGRVIAGWDQGFVGAKVGEVLRLDIPADLAYGANPPGPPIEPDDPLTFVVFVRGLIPVASPDDAPLDLEIPISTDAADTTVEVIEEGTGAVVEAGDTVAAHLLIVRGDNRVVLVNSWEQSAPIQLPLEEGAVFPGFLKALPGTKIGDLLVVTMPPEDAYGEAGEPSMGLPADTDMIAVVKILASF